MLKRQLHVEEPCAADWSLMVGDGATRFCGRCEKDVHGLSELTRRQAEALLDEAQERRLCVRYLFDGKGRVQFAPKLVEATAPTQQVRGARRLVGAGAALAALVTLLAAGGGDRALAEAPAPASAPADAAVEATDTPEDADITLEERIFDQEKQATKALSRYGLELEEEHLYDKQSDDAQLYIVIPQPQPAQRKSMGKIIVR
jgi:hypothetical protein